MCVNETEAEPIFPGNPGESLDQYLRRANEEFAAALDRMPGWASPRFLSVQDLANRSSDGRY